ISGASPTLRLLVLRELVWQFDVALVPPPETVNRLILSTLSDVIELSKRADETAEISAQRICEVLNPPTADDSDKADEGKEAEKSLWVDSDELATTFVELGFAALQRAREIGDEAEFERW